MSGVAIIQPKGKGHIKYIRDKAEKIFKHRFKGNEAFRIDAIEEAMRQHRMYLAAVYHANKREEARPKFMRGTWWQNQNTGLWEKLD